jgi:hypothetical protein
MFIIGGYLNKTACTGIADLSDGFAIRRQATYNSGYRRVFFNIPMNGAAYMQYYFGLIDLFSVTIECLDELYYILALSIIS